MVIPDSRGRVLAARRSRTENACIEVGARYGNHRQRAITMARHLRHAHACRLVLHGSAHCTGALCKDPNQPAGGDYARRHRWLVFCLAAALTLLEPLIAGYATLTPCW